MYSADMKLKPISMTLYTTLAFSLLGSAGFCQDKFLSEDGVMFDISAGQTVPVAAVGAIITYLPFSSTVFDSNIGEYLLPDFELCYSLGPDNWTPVDFAVGEIQWVFGEAYSGLTKSLDSFDNQTGLGSLKLIIPCNLFSNSVTSGQLTYGAPNKLTIFYGENGTLDWSPMSEPTNYLGSCDLLISTHRPEIALVLPENRGLVVGRDTTLLISASQATQTDRVFSINVSPPTLSGPTTATILAGDLFAEITYAVEDIGETRFYATSLTYPGQTFKSQRAFATDPTEYVLVPNSIVENTITLLPNTNEQGSSQRCRHLRPVLPNNDPDDGRHTVVVYGACTTTPQPTCDWGFSIGGPGAGCYNSSKCVWSWNPFSYCAWWGLQKEFTLPVWHVTGITKEVCGSFGGKVGWDNGELPGPTATIGGEKLEYRYTCEWKRSPTGSVKLRSDDCQ